MSHSSNKPPASTGSQKTLLLMLLAIIVILAIVLVLLVSQAARPTPLPPTAPPATALPPNPPPPIAPTPAAGDQAWERIKAAGKIVVGISADYPPFAFYTDQFQMDGFDVQLMRELGTQLGVQVVFNDFAFDGLIGALQIGQVDAAIGALSVSPQREQIIDFSNIYFVSDDGWLSRADGNYSIKSAADLADKRVGVQRGSVYEDWLAPQVPVGRLFSYSTVADSVRDLAARNIDVVVGDLAPMQQAAGQDTTVKLVGQNLNQQRLAIAVRSGATSVRDRLNAALLQVQSSGRLAQLTQQYLKVPPPPLPTPGPTETPVAGPTPTPAGCINSLAFVQDLTYDDKNMTAPPTVNPGQPFTKGWRVINTGTCPWTTAYKLIYVQGNVPSAQMGGQPLGVATDAVPQGGTYDLNVNLIAPANPGVYQGFWQMVDGTNTPFGQRVYVGIMVPGFPTATPPPTQTPVPGLTFTADRTSIRAGDGITFRWNVQGVKAVYLYLDGDDWSNNGVNGVGSRVEYPQYTAAYNLRVLKLDNTYDVRRIPIAVEQPIGPPGIVRFTVNPPDQITLGQCVIVQWEVQGNVSKVAITFTSQVWETAPGSGSRQDCPGGIGPAGYSIVVVGPGGTNRTDKYVNVVSPATATPMPTPPPARPQVDAFIATPNQIEVGQCVQLQWATSGGTNAVQIKRNDAVIYDNAPLSGYTQDCLPAAGTYTFRVVARNSQTNEKDTRDQPVVVVSAPAPNPLADSQWGLIAIGTTTPPGEGVLLKVRFLADGTLDGFGGCTGFSARYVLSGNTLALSNFNVAPGVCVEPEGIMDLQTAFFDALRQARSFNRDGGNLTISGGQNLALQAYTGP